MGETRVDLQHLLEDLRDAYTGALEETILTEVVANALDSGATRIRLRTEPASATLTIVDDGRGMQRRELARYHDVAASTKARGEGIGFAGVGIKLGLLVSSEVVTETRRGATTVATRWHLASRHRAPWKWIPPPGLTASRGTAVRLTLTNQLSPLLDAGYLEARLRRHFEPLLDPAFDDLLRRHYRHGVTFEVDNRTLTSTEGSAFERAPISIRIGRRRLPSVAGFLERGPALPSDLADDFPLLRSLVDRRAGGQNRLPMPGRGKTRVPAPLFANLPAGGGGESLSGDSAAPPPESPSPENPAPPPEPTPPSPEDVRPPRDPSLPEGPSGATDTQPHAHHAASLGTLDTVSGQRRPARYGLLVQFESLPGDPELGRLVDSTLWINNAHPAFIRALASRSLGYHTALAVALALAPLAVDARDEHAFITQFLASWGSAHASRKPSRQRRLP